MTPETQICPHCGAHVVPTADGLCPSCSKAMLDADQVVLAQAVTDSAPPAPTSNELRGVAFGCGYAFLTWVLIGLFAMSVIPVVFYGPKWDHQKIGATVSQFSMIFVCLPIGIYGFIRHRRNKAT